MSEVGEIREFLGSMSHSERVRLSTLFYDMLAMDHPLLIGKWTPRYAILSGQDDRTPPIPGGGLLPPGHSLPPEDPEFREKLDKALAASAAHFLRR